MAIRPATRVSVGVPGRRHHRLPRLAGRANFPIGDPDAAREQIEWEHTHLRRADAIVFWFCAAQIQPIALYELGAWSMTDKPMAIGVEPGYEREQDVRIQTELARPDVEIVDSLRALAKAVVPGDAAL